MNASKVGGFIAELRSEQGLTQQQLAERLHVTFQAVSRWETGRGTPDIENLEALSRELGVSVAELLSGVKIDEPVSSEEVDSIAQDGISLVKEHLRRTITRSTVYGLLAGVAIMLLVVIGLTSPNAMPFHEGLVDIEVSENGILTASIEEGVAGCDVYFGTDPETGDSIAYICCYSKLWNALTGTSDLGWHVPGMRYSVMVGSEETVTYVCYYPGEVQEETAPLNSRTGWSISEVLYAREGSDGFHAVMQPRRVYERLIIGAVVAGAAMLFLFILLRKCRLAHLLLMGALLPLCLALSAGIVLWDKLDQVFEASFFLSEICLLALMLSFCAYFVAIRLIGAKETAGLPTGLVARRAGILVCVSSISMVVIYAIGMAHAQDNDGFRSRTVLVPTAEYVLLHGYPVNSSGLTYGPGGLTASDGEPIEEPNLMLAQGVDGAIGYESLYELDYYYVPATPEEAVAFTESQPSERFVPLYDRDGITVIGEFRSGA